jgi:hypothetical protein
MSQFVRGLLEDGAVLRLCVGDFLFAHIEGMAQWKEEILFLAGASCILYSFLWPSDKLGHEGLDNPVTAIFRWG